MSALIAFLSILITTVGFVTSVEVNFYPKYQKYYGLFGDRGVIGDIELAEKELRDMMKREFVYLGCKQFFTTFLFIVLGPPVLEILVPGISNLSVSIFRFLCVGYGAYAIGNAMMLISLYFEDYAGALWSTTAFAAVSSGMTIWQILYGDSNYYGLGFFYGAILFYFLALLRLEWYARKLPYHLLSRQNLVPGVEQGVFVALCDRLDERQERKRLQREQALDRASDKKLEQEGLKL